MKMIVPPPKKFDKFGTEIACTHEGLSIHLSKNVGERVSQLEYSLIIRSLMYLMSGARPNIAYSVSKLSRYKSKLGHDHWKAIDKVKCYLRYTRGLGLHYTRCLVVLKGNFDANWISDMKDSKCTSGYHFALGATVS